MADDRQVSDDERMRDAFAQLLAQRGSNTPFPMLGDPQAVPMESVWAAQGRNQFPPPQPDLDIRHFPLAEGQGPPDMFTPQRQFSNGERGLKFPVQGEDVRPNPAEAPFGGKGLVVGPYPKPYELPKKPEKNKKKSKKGKD